MAAAEIAGSVSAVVGLASKITELVNTARNKPAKEASAALDQAFGRLVDLQGELLRLQTTAISLQEENAELRRRLGQLESRASESSHFERKKVGRSVVMVPEGEPDIYLCANCFADDRRTYLDPLPEGFEDFGTHRCPRCQALLNLR